MRWLSWPAWFHLFSRAQEERESQDALLHQEPEAPLANADLSEDERRAALEQEAQRRSEGRAR